MTLIALIGGLLHRWPPTRLEKMMPVLLGLSAGSLLGGALFHLLPHAWEHDPGASMIGLATGTLMMVMLEGRWWRGARTPEKARHQLGWLIIAGDAVHNLVGGLAVGSAFLVSEEKGWSAWMAAALHELPQELGDYGVLLFAGWKRAHALLANWLAALPFLAGVLLVLLLPLGHALEHHLLALGAGNFLYIALIGVTPQIWNRYRQRPGAWIAFLMALATLALSGSH